jgi:outer membrane protein assembly factor BamB
MMIPCLRRARVRSLSVVACAALVALLLGGCSGTRTRAELPALEQVVSTMRLHGLWYRQSQIRHLPDEARLTPFVAGKRFFYSDRPDRVVALDARNGRQLWKVALPPAPGRPERSVRLSGGIGAGEGLLFVGTDEGEVIALDPDKGGVQWRAQLSSEVLAPPLAQEGVLVVRTNDGRVAALDPANGNTLWSYSSTVPALTLRGSSLPLIDRDRVFAGFANGKLVALGLTSGEVLWESTVGVPEGRSELERMVDIDADPVLVDGIIYTAAYQARLVALTSVAGSLLWSRDLSTYQGMVAGADALYLSDSDGKVFAVSRRTGAVLWQQDKLAGRAITAPVMYRGNLFVADGQGYLHGLSPDDGHFVARFHVADEAIPLAPIVSDDALYLLTAGGALHALKIDP